MYSTGTASGPTAVLQALATFATSAGFTIDHNSAATGVGWWLAVHKGSCYLNFFTDTANTYIAMCGATGYNGSNTYNTQPGTSPNSGNSCNCGAGPFTGYHFFSTTGSAAYLHVVIEISAGIFAHFQGGALNAVGGASPCIYIQATNWQYTGYYASFPDNGGPLPWSYPNPNGYLGVTVDSTFRWFRPNNSQPARVIWPLQANATEYYGISKSPNTFNGLAVLLPIQSYVERAVGNIYAYVGDAPDMRLLNIKNNNPKDEITIGSDTWKVFPMISNNPNINIGNSPNPSSGGYALAFRKNA